MSAAPSRTGKHRTAKARAGRTPAIPDRAPARLPGRIARLAELAALPERRVLGLMSGTSLDGLDLALCIFRGTGGRTRVRLEHHTTLPYGPEERERLRALVSQPEVPLAELTVLNAWLAARHGNMVHQALADWRVKPRHVHLLASHGQTVYHAPGGWAEDGATRHATLQLGDGDQLAVRTGLLTVSDFRQKEIAAGGQGAPLAPYAEALLFTGRKPRVLLNVGGIANFTWLPPAGDRQHPLHYGDTGPGNGLIDRAVRRGFPGAAEGFDRDGRIAREGRVHAALLAELKGDLYYARPCPKSTGPEMFGDAYLDAVARRAKELGLPPQDLVATLTRLTAETVADTLRRECPRLEGADLFVSGGGAHNRALTGALRELLPEVRWGRPSTLGVPADAKEAVIFAALAHESLFGRGFAPLAASRARADNHGGDAGRPTRFAFGKLSWPD